MGDVAPAMRKRSTTYAWVWASVSDCVRHQSDTRCRSWRTLGVAKLFFQLRLAREDDLQELLGRSFKVGEKANLLEEIPGKILSFVDYDHAGLFHTIALDQPSIELQQHAGFGSRGGDDAEIREDKLQEIEHVEPGIEDKRGRDPGRL